MGVAGGRGHTQNFMWRKMTLTSLPTFIFSTQRGDGDGLESELERR